MTIQPLGKPKKSYQLILHHIKNEIEASGLHAQKLFEKLIIETNWKVGKFLDGEFTKGAIRSKDNAKLVSRLSKDLDRPMAHFYDVVRFYRAYPKLPSRIFLKWSHYNVLAGVTNHKKRQELEDMAIAEEISWKALHKIILQETKAALLVKSDDQINKKGQLICKRGKPYHYKLIFSKELNEAESKPLIDLGFEVFQSLDRVEYSKDSFKRGCQVATLVGKDKFLMKGAQSIKDDLYTYKARVLRVVDGDTLELKIDCGFGISTIQKVRLKGIDAPEIETVGGERVKEHLVEVFKNCTFIVVKTYWREKFGRFLVDIFYLPGEISANRVAAKGIFLNQELLTAGLVKIYK